MSIKQAEISRVYVKLTQQDLFINKKKKNSTRSIYIKRFLIKSFLKVFPKIMSLITFIYIYIYIQIYICKDQNQTLSPLKMDDGPTSPQQYICQRVDFTSKRLSKSSMGHNRLGSCQEDKKTQFERNNIPRSSSRMKCSYIHSSLSKQKVFFFFQITSPFFHRDLSLIYSCYFQSWPSTC